MEATEALNESPVSGDRDGTQHSGVRAETKADDVHGSVPPNTDTDTDSVLSLSAEIPPPPDVAALLQPFQDAVQRLAEPPSPLLPTFESEVKPDEIIVGLMSDADLQAEQARIEAARHAAEEAERRLAEQREAKVAQREQAAADRVREAEVAAESRMRRRLKAAVESVDARETGVHRLFQRAEAHLKARLHQQQGVVHERYGNLEPGRAGARRLKVEWALLPRPLAINVQRIRAVKNKLPAGRYVMLATLYTRLGGVPLHWSKHGFDLPTSSKPVRHRGRYHDIDMAFDQRVHVLCPSEAKLRSSHTIVLELFLLGSRRNPVDRVVGWTALPASTASFDLISGAFKLPLLRGRVDLSVSKYSEMEQTIGRDLDAWLGNVYVEAVQLPRETVLQDGEGGGQLVREFDVELAYTSQLLRLDGKGDGTGGGRYDSDLESEDEDEWAIDGDHAPDALNYNASSKRHRGSLKSRQDLGAIGLGGVGSGTAAGGAGPDHLHHHRRRSTKISRWWERSAGDEGVGVPSRGSHRLSGHIRVPSSTQRGLKGGFWRDFAPERRTVVKAKPGAAPKLPSVPKGLDTHSYSVAAAQRAGVKSKHVSGPSRKLRFLWHELSSDLVVASAKSLGFYVQVVLVLFAVWARLYLHYLGQWMYLQWLDVPVFDFRPTPYSMILKYVPDALPTEYEIGVVTAGHLTNIFAFLVFGFLARLFQWALGHFNSTCSQFIAYFGVATALDGLLVLVVDLCASNRDCQDDAACAANIADDACTCTEGDAFKLWNRFVATEGSGVVGVVLTVLIMTLLFLMSLLALYHFLVTSHLDGRLKDLYRRLSSMDTHFFLPNDMEVSPTELQSICARAQRWTGPKGTKRKIAVCDYVLSDPLDPGFKEVTTHLVIYHATVQGSRELFRHFIRLPDGAIIEMFGDLKDYLGVKNNALQELILEKGKENSEHGQELFPGFA